MVEGRLSEAAAEMMVGLVEGTVEQSAAATAGKMAVETEITTLAQGPTLSCPGYDKVPKHSSIACRQQANFVGRETGKNENKTKI